MIERNLRSYTIY